MGNKVSIAIVGLNIGKRIIEELAWPENTESFMLAAVCDMDREKAETEAAKLGVKAYFDLDALLADDDIQAIGLFTGPVNRSALIRKIIQAGKDVMTTKPFEQNPAAARAVLEEAELLNRVVHLNSPSPLPSEDLQIVADWREKHAARRLAAA